MQITSLYRVSQYFTYFTLALMIVCSIFVRNMMAISNISMILCLIAIILQSIANKKLPNYNDWLLVIPFFGIFISYLIGGIVSSEKKEYFHHLLQINLIMVLMPALILLLKPFNFEKEKVCYTFFLSSVLLLTCFWSLQRYLEQYQVKNLADIFNLKQGIELGTIVAELWHHTLSLYLLFAIALQFDYLLSTSKKSNLNRLFSISVIGIFIVFIHLLLSRWSMLCLYAFIVFILVKLFYKPNFTKIQITVTLLLFIFSTYFVAMYPPDFLKSRVLTTIDGINQTMNGNFDVCSSVGGRIFAIQHGLLFVSSKPWTGVSVDYYHTYFVTMFDKMKAPEGCRAEVHNQFLRTAATYGLPVMLLMSICIYIHCFRKQTSTWVIIAAHFFLFGYSLFDTPFNITNFIYFYAINFPLLVMYFAKNKSN
jgi:hypothetical protein